MASLNRRAKCSLEHAVATDELFEVEEKKPELLMAARPALAVRLSGQKLRLLLFDLEELLVGGDRVLQ